jgi:hypothetical protein
MELNLEKIADLRVKHLEMVQAIVTRLANQGATIKNYCITVTTAICGFAITLHQPTVALLALFPLVVFGLLDAQFLRLERRFRALFDQIRNEDWGKSSSFEINLHKSPKISYVRILFSWSILWFYAPIAVGVVIVVLIARCIPWAS